MGAKHGAAKGRKTWKEEREQEAAELGFSRQPYCVIVGGGQGGIALGARLRQLDVPTIIIDKHERPGDSWRKRYKSLCLHDPVWYDHLPYLDFPENWPVFSPKDKIGDWLEMYTKVMELNYWSSTECLSASFDEPHRRVDGHGRSRRRAGHAAGRSSWCWPPACRASRTCRISRAWTSSRAISTTRRGIPGPDGYVGRRAVVIGSNNSAHDICAALWEAGVDVTMVQRSPTHIVKSNSLMELAPRPALLRAGGPVGHDHRHGRPDIRLAALQDPARIPDPDLRGDQAARRRFLPASREAPASCSTGARTSRACS